MKNEYSFSGQKPGENVIEVVPSHPYVLYPPGFKTILLWVLALAIFLFFTRFAIVGIVIVFFSLLYFINKFYSFKETVLIVTNMRIFAINQKGFFKRKITEVELNKIIDMSSDTQGLAKMMLKFGDLTIRTAGDKEYGTILLQNIAHPYEVQQRISGVLKGV